METVKLGGYYHPFRVAELIDFINYERRRVKQNWLFLGPLYYNYEFVPCGTKTCSVEYAGFETWCQRLVVDGISYTSEHGLLVRDYKEWLFNVLGGRGVSGYISTAETVWEAR